MSDFLPESMNACPTSPTTDIQPGQQWQHVKRGTAYEVLGVAELQNGNVKGLREGARLAVYRGDDGKLWAREEGEFSDGRFRLTSTTPTLGDVSAHIDTLQYLSGQYLPGGPRDIKAAFRAAIAALSAAPASPIPTATGDMGEARLALEAIKAVTATTKDAVAGLSRIMVITRSAGVDASYSDLMAKADVALIVNSPRTEWRHLFERADACTIPPEGWTCSRTPGHDGPCAASPIPTSANEGVRDRLKDAIWELLSHRGERPGRLLRGGQELWETWVPAFEAAMRYLSPALSPALDNTAVEGRA